MRLTQILKVKLNKERYTFYVIFKCNMKNI